MIKYDGKWRMQKQLDVNEEDIKTDFQEISYDS
jgi:hypothetical protein